MKSNMQPGQAASGNLNADTTIELFYEFKTSMLSISKSHSSFTLIFIIFSCFKYRHKLYDTKIIITCENRVTRTPCLNRLQTISKNVYFYVGQHSTCSRTLSTMSKFYTAKLNSRTFLKFMKSQSLIILGSTQENQAIVQVSFCFNNLGIQPAPNGPSDCVVYCVFRKELSRWHLSSETLSNLMSYGMFALFFQKKCCNSSSCDCQDPENGMK